MIDKEAALEVKKHGLDAIKSLSQALSACENKCAPEDFVRIKRAVFSMGRIETELLAIVYVAYPELDDLV